MNHLAARLRDLTLTIRGRFENVEKRLRAVEEGGEAVQLPAGGVLTANVPYVCEVIMAGRSGATPTPITLQMAAETAAANVCFIKAGSFIKTRSGF